MGNLESEMCAENTGLALKALEVFEKLSPLYFKFFLSGWHLECRPLDSTPRD